MTASFESTFSPGEGFAPAALSKRNDHLWKDSFSGETILHLCQHPSGMPSKAQGFSHELKISLLRCPTSTFGDKAPWYLSTAATRSPRSIRHWRRSDRSPPDTFLPSLRSGRSFESHAGLPKDWKGPCQQPSGPPPWTFGFSHGLKTVHRTVFAFASLRPAFRIPYPFHKKYRGISLGIFYGVDNGIRTHDLQSHNLTR